MMKEGMIAKLTFKDDKYACALADKIISESQETDEWYEYFDAIISDFLTHITDEKPITARQCVKALAQVGLAKPQYIPRILSCLKSADLSKYKDSMRPLIEKDIAEAVQILTTSGL